jgi:hypothetical protein
MAHLGPVSLLTIVQDVLVRWKSLLGDIGDLPFFLIKPVLEAADPNELMTIEDATRKGVAGRSLAPLTWYLWYKHCNSPRMARLASLPDIRRFPLPDAIHQDDVSIPPADYRRMYEDMMRQLQDKQKSTVKRVQEAWAGHAKDKAARAPLVIPPMMQRKKGGAGAKGAKKASTVALPTVKDRLRKKLGLRKPAPAPQKLVPIVKRDQHKAKPKLPSREALLRPIPPRPNPSKPVKQEKKGSLVECDLFGM